MNMFAPTVDGCSGMLIGDGDYFSIVVNQLRSVTYSVETIGHEIAHTFGYGLDWDFGRQKLVKIWPPGFIDKEVERFCEEFAAKWLLDGSNRERAERLLEEIFLKGKIIIY